MIASCRCSPSLQALQSACQGKLNRQITSDVRMRTILFEWLVGWLGALLYYTLVAAACLGGVMLLDWLLFPRAPDGTLTMAGRCAKAPWHRDSGYRLREKAECDRWKAAGQPADWDGRTMPRKCGWAADKADRLRDEAECERWKAAGYPEDWK